MYSMTSDPDSHEVVARPGGTGPAPTIKPKANPGPRSARSHSHALTRNRGGSSHSAIGQRAAVENFLLRFKTRHTMRSFLILHDLGPGHRPGCQCSGENTETNKRADPYHKISDCMKVVGPLRRDRPYMIMMIVNWSP